MKKGSIEYGAKQAIENCLKVKEGEKLVIITDKETLEIGTALKKAAEERTKTIDFYVLEDFGERPEDGINPLKCPEKILESLNTADKSIYCAKGKKNELESLREPIMKKAFEKGVKHAHMPGITMEMMETGMSSDYAEIERVSKKVYEIVKGAKEITVETEKGTKLTAKFSPELRWVCSFGDPAERNPHFCNLPDGEVFTSPADVNGHVVIDGCLGDFFGKYGDIEKTPVELDIENGRVVKGSVKCSDKQLEEELNKYVFETDENSNRIGEFAIGTNVDLKKIIGNLLQDEKFPGVHIAFGDSLPEMTGAKWKSKVHCDGVIRKPTVTIDGKTIMEEGNIWYKK